MPTWTNTQLERWMKDAEEDIVSQVYMRFTSFSLAITSGTALYSFNERIFKPISVQWKGKPLSPYIGKEIHSITPKFRELTGEPTSYQMSNDGVSTIRLIPVPNTSIPQYDSGLESTNISNAFIIRAFVFPDRDLDYFQIPDYVVRNLVKCYVLKRAFNAEGIGQNLRAAEYWNSRYEFLIQALKETRAGYYQTKERLDLELEGLDCQKKRLPYLPPDFVLSAAKFPLHAAAFSTLNFWLDALEIGFDAGDPFSKLFADSLNNWQDSFTLSHGNIFNDSYEFQDSLTANIEYRVPFTDDLNNWNDTLGLINGYQANFSDDLNNWNQFLQLGLGMHFSDDLNNWNDEIALFLAGSALSLMFSDTLANWNDECILGYGHIHTDDCNNWQDDINNVLGMHSSFADDLNLWTDELVTLPGFGLNFTDDLNNWNDARLIGHGLIFTDNMNNWADATVRNLAYLKTFTDDLNLWADAVNATLGGGGGLPVGADIIYEFNDGSGQVLTDSSGNANHGQLGDTTGAEASDPSWATDGGEIVLDFVLSTDWVEIPRMNYTGAFTVVIVYNKDTTNDNQELITATDAGSTGQRVLARSSSTSIRVAGVVDVTTAGVSTDVWTMLSYRRDGSNKVDSFVNNGTALRLYADAAQSSTYGFDRIGGGGNATDLDGQIAFFACWPSALTDSQIQNDVYDYVKALKPGIGLP